MANVRADGTPCWWTTSEDRILRHVYPLEGLQAAVAVLPGRTPRAIRQRALSLGLKAPRLSRAGLPRVRWHDTPELDAVLREQIPQCKSVLDARKLADRLGRPIYWLNRRCTELGLDVPSQPVRPWTREELALLQEHAHLPAHDLARVMRRAGYRRTPGAIALRLRRAAVDRTDPDSHTTSDLAQLLGVSAQTVLVWITSHGLRATRRQPDTGEAGQRHRVHRRDLRARLRDNPTKVDLSKVDGPWFLDLALGAAA